jgi:hypothetical protein
MQVSPSGQRCSGFHVIVGNRLEECEWDTLATDTPSTDGNVSHERLTGGAGLHSNQHSTAGLVRDSLWVRNSQLRARGQYKRNRYVHDLACSYFVKYQQVAASER